MERTKLTTKRDYLAQLIAQTFNVEADIKRYQNVCRKYALRVVWRAFAEAKSVPASQIKKSRPALFFYLLKKYSHEQKNHSRH